MRAGCSNSLSDVIQVQWTTPVWVLLQFTTRVEYYSNWEKTYVCLQIHSLSTSLCSWVRLMSTDHRVIITRQQSSKWCCWERKAKAHCIDDQLFFILVQKHSIQKRNKWSYGSTWNPYDATCTSFLTYSYNSQYTSDLNSMHIMHYCGLIWTGPPKAGSGPDKNCFSGPTSKGGPAKNLYTKSERLIIGFRVTWAWSERVNLYNRQIMILPRHTKTYATYSGPGPPSGPPGPGNSPTPSPVSSALDMNWN
jgi:hypothetical protein